MFLGGLNGYGFLKSLFNFDINNLSYQKAFTKALEAEKNKDYKLAIQLYELVIQKGFYEHKSYAYNNLAVLYKQGLDVDKDIEKSKKLFGYALSDGLHQFCTTPSTILNIKYFEIDNTYKCPQDNVKALGKCIELAKNGDVDLQYKLHEIFKFGIYAQENYEQSQYWFNLAAENGHEYALATIEVDKKFTEEKERDDKAIKHAKEGDPKGMYDLALMIIHYRKSEEYEGEFVDLIEKSASKGYSKAQYFLGLLYEAGNYLHEYERGGEKGLILKPIPTSIPLDYIPNLSSMHFFNSPNKPNIDKAIQWYKESAYLNYQPAIDRLKHLGAFTSDDNSHHHKGIDLHNIVDALLEKYGIDYIYHITHYKNLESILKNGLLSHNNKLAEKNIDNPEVNDRRNKIEPINNKNLHSYVPFYFNPKNPMLFVNKAIQKDIIILAFDKDLLLKEKTIFTDGNAATNRTHFYSDLKDLDQLNWDCLNANYWNDFEDGKREVMAEALIPTKVDINHLKKIYCFDDETGSFILDIDDNLDFEKSSRFYF